MLGCSAWLLERALTRLRLPVRWAWIGALGLSIWLPLESFVSGSERRDGTVALATAEVVVPFDQTEFGEEPNGGREQGAGAAVELLVGWKAGVRRVLASGAALLPATALSPTWIACVWGAASILVGMVLTASIVWLHRRSRRWPDETLLGRQVKVSPNLGPATIGLFTARIVIPQWAKSLPPHELELVLRHEAEHAAARDTPLLALGLVAVIVCPWNPLVWWPVRRLKYAVELD